MLFWWSNEPHSLLCPFKHLPSLMRKLEHLNIFWRIPKEKFDPAIFRQRLNAMTKSFARKLFQKVERGVSWSRRSLQLTLLRLGRPASHSLERKMPTESTCFSTDIGNSGRTHLRASTNVSSRLSLGPSERGAGSSSGSSVVAMWVGQSIDCNSALPPAKGFVFSGAWAEKDDNKSAEQRIDPSCFSV